MKKIVIFFILFSGFFSCKNNDKVMISCDIKNLYKEEVIFEEILPEKLQVIEQFIVKNEKFNIKLNNKDLKNCFYRLKIGNENILLYLSKNENIIINASYPKFTKNYQIINSYNNELIKILNSQMLLFADTVEYYENQLKNKQLRLENNIEKEIILTNKKIKTVFDSAQNYLEQFIKENYTSPIIYLCLYQYITSYPIFKIENNFEIFKFVCENLEKYNPELEQLLALKSIVERKKIEISERNKSKTLKIGDTIPDFEIKDCNGKMLKLSQISEKQIILFFWASWNNNSLKEIPKILKMKKENNTEIIFFSLDDNFRSWNNCLKDLNIKKMQNICDFKTWESPIVRILGIKNIPYYVVIDNNRKIIETNCFDSQPK